MLATIASLALALQVASPAPPTSGGESLVQEIKYRAYAHPPPCGHSWDLSARDDMCYPNGALPPQDQAARQRYYGQGYGDPGYGGREYGVADIAVAGIRSPAATELISISGMAVAIPPAQCHADFKTAAVIDRASLPDRR